MRKTLTHPGGYEHLWWLVLVLAVVFPIVTAACEDKPSQVHVRRAPGVAPSLEKRTQALERAVGTLLQEQIAASQHPPVDPEIAKAAVKWQVAYADFQQGLMRHTDRGFSDQAFASGVILWVVVAVVSAGLVFAGVQLIYGLRTPSGLADSTLELSWNKVRVTSSIVGTVVLTISIAFLYLYLKEVYNLKPLDVNRPATPTPAAPAGAKDADKK